MITIIQILTKENENYKQIIQTNEAFLSMYETEYLVYDNLKTSEVLSFIKNSPKIKYIRKSFKNTKSSMLESGLLANSDQIIYLKSTDILTDKTISELEKSRPKIFKKDLGKIAKLKKENFDYDKFQLLIKEKKSLWEKLQIWFILN